MSLKISLEVPNSQHSLELACVMPAAFQEIAHDYSNGAEKIVIAACDAKDAGGFVYVLRPNDWAQLLSGVSPENFDLKPAFKVEEGSRRGAKITRLSGAAGRLVFTHIAGYEPRATVRRDRKK